MTLGAASHRRISAIIPTWNEQLWLARLLESIGEEPAVAEIVVADNASDDGTADIARAYGCALVPGGLPAVGKNAGARAAREELLLFVDADVAVSKEVIAAALSEFRNSQRTLVHFRLVPMTSRRFVRACYSLADVYASTCAAMGRHQGSAPLIVVRRTAFIAVGGFDEGVHAAEDVEFIRRVSRRLGGVAYVRSVPVLVSPRRWRVETPIVYALKCMMWGFIRLLGGKVSFRRYRWVRYPPHLSPGAELNASPGVVVLASQVGIDQSTCVDGPA